MLTVTIKSYMLKRVIQSVLDENSKENILPGLKQDTSVSGGFSLPMTAEWLKTPFRGFDIARKFHQKRTFLFQYDEDENVCGMRCKDDCEYWTCDEIDYLHCLILNALQNARAKVHYVNCDDILEKYELEPDIILQESLNVDDMDEMMYEIKERMTEKPMYGDIVQLIPDESRDDNDGTLIMNKSLQVLSTQEDMHGSISRDIKVTQGGFNPEYWCHNLSGRDIIYLDGDIYDQVIQNWNYEEKLSTVNINGKDYFFVITKEYCGSNFNLNDNFEYRVRHEHSPVYITSNTAYTDGRDLGMCIVWFF